MGNGGGTMPLEDLVGLGTLNHWARADAANGTGASMFAAYSTVRLALEGYRRFSTDESTDEKTARAKRELHEAIASFVVSDETFEKASQQARKALLEKEVQRQVGILSLKLQSISG